jgi:hypothetical protein
MALSVTSRGPSRPHLYGLLVFAILYVIGCGLRDVFSCAVKPIAFVALGYVGWRLFT